MPYLKDDAPYQAARHEAKLVQDLLPTVSNIKIELMYPPAMNSPQSTDLHNFGQTSRAYFNFLCPHSYESTGSSKGCVASKASEWGYDLTPMVMELVSQHKTLGTGELECPRWEDSRRRYHCYRKALYSVEVTYKAD